MKWTKEEEEFLKENYNLYKIQELANKLGKNRNQVRFKMKSLKITLSPEEIKKRKTTSQSDIKKGDIYNRWTLISDPWIEKIGPNKTGKVGIFKCECGKEKKLKCSRIKNGHSKSCGCLTIEKSKERKVDQKRKDNPYYQYWTRFKDDFCEEWKNLDCFSKDMISIGFTGGMCLRRPDISRPYSLDNYKIGHRKDFGINANIMGKKFNRLLVTSNAEKINKSYYCYCKCDCGKEIFCQITGIRSGRKQSCGCLIKEKLKEQRELNYGKAKTHKQSYHRWLKVLSSAKKRGCDICPDWLNFEIFDKWFNDNYIKGYFIFNCNSDKPYGPDSCKFISRKEMSYYVFSLMSEEDKEIYTSKRLQTTIERYGVENVARSEEIREKTRQTLLRKYGVERLCDIPGSREKAKETCLKRFGVENPWLTKEAQSKAIQTKIEKYGPNFFLNTNGKQESEFGEFLNSFGYKFEPDWKILGGKQLDFYCPELNLAFEFNGLHWHNEKSKTPRLRNYHYDKYNNCRKQNIRLISIWSDEWLNRNEQVKNHIAAILSNNQTRVFARKCEVKIIDKDTAKKFIDQNHMQGESNILIAAGLFYNEELVGAVSFAKHHRSKGIVLNRMCFKNGITVIGGASKLIAKCIPELKNIGSSKIITWSDNRYSEGNVYEKIGFTMEQELKQDYQYVLVSNPKSRFSKQSMQKANTGCPIDMTEKEWMELNGFARIWDCGKKRWIMEI